MQLSPSDGLSIRLGKGSLTLTGSESAFTWLQQQFTMTLFFWFHSGGRRSRKR